MRVRRGASEKSLVTFKNINCLEDSTSEVIFVNRHQQKPGPVITKIFSSVGGVGGASHEKVTGVLMGYSERNHYSVPRCCFWAWLQINFNPKRYKNKTCCGYSVVYVIWLVLLMFLRALLQISTLCPTRCLKCTAKGAIGHPKG